MKYLEKYEKFSLNEDLTKYLKPMSKKLDKPIEYTYEQILDAKGNLISYNRESALIPNEYFLKGTKVILIEDAKQSNTIEDLEKNTYIVDECYFNIKIQKDMVDVENSDGCTYSFEPHELLIIKY